MCHAHGSDIIAASTLLDPGKESIPPVTPGYVYLAYPLKMIPFMIPGSKDLIQAVRKHFSGTSERALLLQNHGLIAVGKSYQEAVNIIEEIDEAAKIWLITKGMSKVIQPDDIVRIKDL